MVHARVPSHVALHVHIGAVWWVSDLLNAAWVADLHVQLLTGVGRVESLIIAETIQVLVVLLEDLKVVFAV